MLNGWEAANVPLLRQYSDNIGYIEIMERTWKLLRRYMRAIQRGYLGYIGIIEKKMETAGIIGGIRGSSRV